jgi:hypothetical protein
MRERGDRTTGFWSRVSPFHLATVIDAGTFIAATMNFLSCQSTNSSTPGSLPYRNVPFHWLVASLA